MFREMSFIIRSDEICKQKAFRVAIIEMGGLMAYEFMYSAAMDIIQSRISSGDKFGYDDTVCVIYTRSGKICTGFSRTENTGGQPGVVHAEIEALRIVQTYNESAIEAIMLVHILSRGLILPCNNCLGYIVSLNSSNAQSVIVVSDRLIRVSEVSKFVSAPAGAGLNVPPPSVNAARTGVMQGGIQNSGASGYISPDQPQKPVYTPPSERAKGDYLKKRVNKLMRAAEDDEDEVSEEKKGRGIVGGLFGR
ncbi:MAG TPA: hypothetical protein DCZ71_07990 [Ruminococcus sp.]|nr:hypothetical protein [Ruminococcus sp.]